MGEKTYDVVYPKATPPEVILEKNVYATMRDGVKVALDVYKPEKQKGPWPVIIGYSGFPKEFFFESALHYLYLWLLAMALEPSRA